MATNEAIFYIQRLLDSYREYDRWSGGPHHRLIRCHPDRLVLICAAIKASGLGDRVTAEASGWFLGGGTDTAAAIRATFKGHDRVVIVTDEQAGVDPVGISQSIPATVPMYSWNLAGHEAGHAPSGGGNRHTFGGLTDAAFRMIPNLEAGINGAWPWEQRAA